MKPSFIGSTTVMVIGVISFISQIRHWPNVSDDELLGGITMVLGALAYRLAKQRRLGLAPDTRWKPIVEIVLLLLVFVPTFLEARVQDGIIHNPLGSYVIPIWSVAAYLTVRYRRVQPRGGSDLNLSKS